MEIIYASLPDTDIIERITYDTINSVYPRYYPKGAVDFFIAHHSSENIRNDILSSYVFLCKDNGKYVGTVTIKKNEILRLFVLPDCQGNGYGRALLDHAEELISLKFDKILIDASLSAKSIYIKRGYKETEYHIIETDNGDHLCYDVMEKQVCF